VCKVKSNRSQIMHELTHSLSYFHSLLQLEADTTNCDPKRDPKCIPKLNSDEALCKYGQSGAARGEACKRVKEAGGSLNKPGASGVNGG
jgi:hypothetical protein